MIKIKNTFSSSDENNFSTSIPYSLLPSFKEIEKEVQGIFDDELPVIDFLKIEILLGETNADWNVIIQFLDKEEVIFYKKITHIDGKTSVEETTLPFGFQPFSSIKNDVIDALKIAQTAGEEEERDCFTFRLYFPLSPFDTEPLWFLNFENNKQAIIGADTGSLEMKDLS